MTGLCPLPHPPELWGLLAQGVIILFRSHRCTVNKSVGLSLVSQGQWAFQGPACSCLPTPGPQHRAWHLPGVWRTVWREVRGARAP